MRDRNPSVLWVFPGSLADALDSATWIETSAELSKLGWNVTLVATDVPAGGAREGVNVICLPRPHVYLIGLIAYHVLLLRKVARSLGSIDVVLCHQDSAPFLLPIALLRRLRCLTGPKIVMDSRTVGMDTVSLRGKLHDAYFRAVHRLANSLADGQTAITRHMAEVVGIPDRQLLGLWPSGVKVEDFRRATSIRRWPESDEPLRLVYIGVLRPERNLLALCDGVRLARSAGAVVTLEFIGEGPLRPELERYAGESGPGAISVRHAVPHSLVPEALATGHVGVLPFRDETKIRVSSFIKLFEYMAAGLPILATRVVAHTDVLQDSECVFWAEDGSPEALASAIGTAYARKLELKGMSERIALAADAWSWQTSARQLSDALLRVAGNTSIRRVEMA
jgi:glycosyltransferase involved in cell wall biosynthesis